MQLSGICLPFLFVCLQFLFYFLILLLVTVTNTFLDIPGNHITLLTSITLTKCKHFEDRDYIFVLVFVVFAVHFVSTSTKVKNVYLLLMASVR